MCAEQELSNKYKYPTFARTEPIGHQLTLALRVVLEQFKWKKFGLMVEQSPVYLKVHSELKYQFNDQILVEKEIAAPAHYSYSQHYNMVLNDMKKIKRQARSKFVLLYC